MVQSPSWEANWFAASQEIPRTLRNPKVHYRTHKRPPPVYILGPPNPVHNSAPLKEKHKPPHPQHISPTKNYLKYRGKNQQTTRNKKEKYSLFHLTKKSTMKKRHPYICVLLFLCVHCCLCVYCCFYFRCRTAGSKSVLGRSCDRPPRHRFFLVSLCL